MNWTASPSIRAGEACWTMIFEIESRLQSNPAFSQQFSLWTKWGRRVRVDWADPSKRLVADFREMLR